MFFQIAALHLFTVFANWVHFSKLSIWLLFFTSIKMSQRSEYFYWFCIYGLNNIAIDWIIFYIKQGEFCDKSHSPWQKNLSIKLTCLNRFSHSRNIIKFIFPSPFPSLCINFPTTPGDDNQTKYIKSNKIKSNEIYYHCENSYYKSRNQWKKELTNWIKWAN